MELFVVLLALCLTAAEKLNRRYLPPTGAKFAGGRSDDLQTPLEYPKQTPNFGTSEYGSNAYVADDTGIVKIGTPDGNELSLMVTNGPYYESLSHLRSGIDPGLMPIIAVPESIGKNYQPNLFGMYGGKPMTIKNFNYDIDLVGTDDLITSDEKINIPEVKVEPAVKQLQNTRNPQAEKYLPATPSSNKKSISFEKFDRPQTNKDESAIVLNYKNVQNPDGYFYNFDTSNGIHRNESASTAKGVKAKGFYSYKGDDGKVYNVTYTADENGFQPSGDHLPPIPEAIKIVIEQGKRNKEAGIIDDGSYDENKYGHMKYQGPIHRYMQENAKTHKRKQVSGNNKIFESKIMNYKTKNIKKMKTGSLQPKLNKNRTLFGMRRVFVNSRNSDNNIYMQPPKTKANQIYTSDLGQKPDYNKVVSNDMVLQNVESSRGSLNSNKEKNFEIFATQDGYFYIPPENIFVDGKYQDKSYTGINILEPITEFNINEQHNENDKLSTESLNHQSHDSHVYVNTNPDLDESIDNTKTILKSGMKSDTEINKELYSTRDTFSTKSYDNEFTDEIVQEKATVIPENRIETDILSTQRYFDRVDYLSTTPMPSAARNTDKTYENTSQFATTSSEFAQTSSNFYLDYSENKGYFKTTPEKPATFEDIPLSTDNPSIYTLEGIVSTESTKNFKVDEYGRTRQDSFGYFTDSSIDSFTTGNQNDTDPKATSPFDDYEEILSTHTTMLPNDKTITQFPDEFGLDVNVTPVDLHLGRDTIIGEDFSGPKQPQRYDPKNGYYY